MGFENKIEKEDFLLAVRRGRTLSDSKLSERLGVNRTTVWRYKKDNPDVVKEAEQILDESVNRYNWSKTKPDYDTFASIPSVAEWIDTQQKRNVSPKVIRGRVNSLNNVCHHLKTTPDALSIDRCADLVYEMRTLMEQDKTAPSGLSYYTIRKSIRNWFELVQGISAQLLSSKGIDAKASKGVGTMAQEKITKEQRAQFDQIYMQALKMALKDTQNPPQWSYQDLQNAGLELQAMAHFMYYTANRITSTHNIMLNDPKHVFAGDIWEIHTIDKGRNGGKHWQKPLIGDGKAKLETYISKRFNIPVEEIPIRAPEMNTRLFPTISENKKVQRLETLAMKYAHRLTGAKVTMPNHSWRHTFAQDWLHATDWNYELGAEIGGWTSTETMKKCYGKISKDAIKRGLRHAMGEPVEDVTYELLW